MEISTEMIVAVASALTTIGGAILAIQKISKNIKTSKEEDRAAILQEAKEEIALVKAEFKGQIDASKWELNALRESMDKELVHIRETYNSEIKNLGEKIEDLRDQLTSQHGQTMALLTKFITKAD